jgi:plastocyanin
MRALRVVGVVLLLAAAGACSSDSKVGKGIDVNRLNAKANRLGELNLPKNKGTGGFVGQQEQKQQQQQAAAGQQQSSTQARAAAAAAQQRQIEQSAVAFRITSSGYDPYYIRVFKGGSIKVTNADATARTVTADRGEFDSDSIAPGDTWVYQANTVGKFNFHDGTRPFVVGTLEVLAK